MVPTTSSQQPQMSILLALRNDYTTLHRPQRSWRNCFHRGQLHHPHDYLRTHDPGSTHVEKGSTLLVLSFPFFSTRRGDFRRLLHSGHLGGIVRVQQCCHSMRRVFPSSMFWCVSVPAFLFNGEGKTLFVRLFLLFRSTGTLLDFLLHFWSTRGIGCAPTFIFGWLPSL